VEWSVVLLLGASLAMVEALNATEAINWLAQTFFIALKGLAPTMVGFLLMFMIIVIRLSFPNLLTMIATTFPLVLSMAVSLDINPIWLGLIGISASALGIFLPTQSLALLTTYNAGYYSIRDLMRAGTTTAFIIIIITTLAANFYWPLLGISP